MLSVMIKSKLPQFLGKGKKGRKKGKGKKGPKLGLNWRVKAMYGSDKAFDSVRHLNFTPAIIASKIYVKIVME